MQKFIHNIALAAGLVVLTCGLWQDWAVWLTLKRMFLSYLGFFGGGTALYLTFRAVRMHETKPLKEGENQTSGRRSAVR